MKAFTVFLSLTLAVAVPGASASETGTDVLKKSIARGGIAVSNVFSQLAISTKAYDNLWKQWGLKEKPKNFTKAVMKRYGLYQHPFRDSDMPMGLHKRPVLFSTGIANDCLMCHAGRIAGQTIIGLGNNALDLQSLADDIIAGDLPRPKIPIRISNVRGTIEASAVTLYLLSYRNPDLTLRSPLKYKINDQLCENIPAWWHMRRKKTMYFQGTTQTSSVRSLMAFSLSPFHSDSFIKKQESKFRDVQNFLKSLRAPKYPFPIDHAKAKRGHAVFQQTCAKCHGTYGENGIYPNELVSVKKVGTDPALATQSYSTTVEKQLKSSWIFQERDADGKSIHRWSGGVYQAPPLDGIWASAPYFHNGSVPTVYHVLNSKTRPKIFTRTYQNEKADYDAKNLGLRIRSLNQAPITKLTRWQLRRIYDTAQPGRGNQGHTFGDKLTEDERRAVIEYLKTL